MQFQAPELRADCVPQAERESESLVGRGLFPGEVSEGDGHEIRRPSSCWAQLSIATCFAFP